MDIVLGKLKKEKMEITELSSRKIETSSRVKQVVLKVSDVSGATFETLSAALSAERLITMEERCGWLNINDLTDNTGISWDGIGKSQLNVTA